MAMLPVIDALDFARNARTHHGKIAVSELLRLQDYLTDDPGSLQYGIAGALDEEGKSVLRIEIHGSINLRCQRCLGTLVHVLGITASLLLAKDETELSRLDEDEAVDCILAGDDLDILTLIEDELILSLPSSPRHGEGECAIVEGGNDGYGRANEGTPFAGLAALAALKKSH